MKVSKVKDLTISQMRKNNIRFSRRDNSIKDTLKDVDKELKKHGLEIILYDHVNYGVKVAFAVNKRET